MSTLKPNGVRAPSLICSALPDTATEAARIGRCWVCGNQTDARPGTPLQFRVLCWSHDHVATDQGMAEILRAEFVAHQKLAGKSPAFAKLTKRATHAMMRTYGDDVWLESVGKWMFDELAVTALTGAPSPPQVHFTAELWHESLKRDDVAVINRLTKIVARRAWPDGLFNFNLGWCSSLEMLDCLLEHGWSADGLPGQQYPPLLSLAMQNYRTPERALQFVCRLLDAGANPALKFEENRQTYAHVPGLLELLTSRMKA